MAIASAVYSRLRTYSQTKPVRVCINSSKRIDLSHTNFVPYSAPPPPPLSIYLAIYLSILIVKFISSSIIRCVLNSHKVPTFIRGEVDIHRLK